MISRAALRVGVGLLCGLSIAATGCKTGNAASKLAQAPTIEEATGQSKCSVKASAAKPLVVEWPAAERAALEARASRGLVAVRYEGCEMEVLTNCTATGMYSYLGLNQKREAVRIKDADELYAQLPVGAAGLEAKLARAGQLNVDMVIIGRKESDTAKFTERDLDGRCEAATHVITGLTVGAFSFYTGASAEVGAAVKVGNIGAGGKSSADREVLKQDGDEAACGLAEQGSDEPPQGCGALLRVEVVPVDRIFATSQPIAPAAATSSAAGTTPTDTPPPSKDPKLDKKIRTWRIVTITSYSLALASVGGFLGGILLKRSAESKLNSLKTSGGLVPGDSERQKQIRNGEIGAGLTIGFAVLGVVAFGLGVTGSVIGKKLQQKKRRMAITPTAGPDGGGAAVRIRF